MTFFYFLASFLLIRRLIKRYKLSPIYPKWKTLLNTASWVIIVFFCLALKFDDWGNDFFGSLTLLGLLI
jgi:two-component system NtrC family sensor kinase